MYNMPTLVSNRSSCKADFKPETAGNYSLNDAESWEIIKLIQDFPRIINRAADNYEPSIIS